MSDPEPWQRSHHEAQKEIARLQAERDELAREVERLQHAIARAKGHPRGLHIDQFKWLNAALKGDDA